MKDGGYLRVRRAAVLGGDPLWKERREWSRAEAWMYVLAAAEPAPDNKLLFSASLREMALAWGWDRSRVQRFLDLLEKLERLRRYTDRYTDRYTYLVDPAAGSDATRYTDRYTKRDTPPSPPPHTPPPTPTPLFPEGIPEQIAARHAAMSTQPPAVLTFPCMGTGPKEWHLTQVYLDELAEAYPGIPVLPEARKALAWVKANRPKTAGGMRRFLVSWLNKAAQAPPQRNGAEPRKRPPGYAPEDMRGSAPEFDPFADEEKA